MAARVKQRRALVRSRVSAIALGDVTQSVETSFALIRDFVGKTFGTEAAS